MAASTGAPRQTAATFPPIPLRKRLYGFGSIYGKTVRDSRLVVHHRGRHARRAGARHGRGHRHRVPDARGPARGQQARQRHAGVDGQPVRQRDADGRQARDAGRLRHLEVRRHVQPGHRVLVDPRPVRHARRRGRPRQPRHRRDLAVRQAPDRAREAGRPPDPAVAGGAGGRGHARRELERLRRRGAGRPDPARQCARVRALGRRHRDVLRRARLRARPAARARRLGRRRLAR